jgi:hypothetical protein
MSDVEMMRIKERIDKDGFWETELRSLGLEPKNKNELNDSGELETLANIVKQSMYQDYKVAYSEQGDNHEQEAMATVTV